MFLKLFEVIRGISFARIHTVYLNERGLKKMPRGAIYQDAKSENDRRRYPRIPMDIPVDICFDHDNKGNFRKAGVTVDVSPAGILLKTKSEYFHRGQSLLFYPSYPEQPNDNWLRGRIRWVKKRAGWCLNGISIEDRERFFLSFLSAVSQNSLSISFVDSMIDTFSDSVFLVDAGMSIISVSKRHPLVPVDREKVRGEKITEIPSVLKLFSSEQFNLKHDLQEVLYTRNDKQHRALPLEFGKEGEKDSHVFNISYRYLNSPSLKESVLIQVRDVTALCRLKENIEKKNRNLFEQYRFTLMGHIIDELLEDLICPLSAVVGRIDLLKMKMSGRAGPSPQVENAVDDWLRELETIDGLVEQITQHCTVAAKRREREKLGAFKSDISLNSLVKETLMILSVHERFRKIEISMDLKKGLPRFKGEYFDWLNAVIALLQCLSREMQTQREKRLKIETFEKDEYLVLSVSHNAKALKMPLEQGSGLSIFDLIQKKYKTAIETAGGNGRQKISFYIRRSITQ